MSRTWFTSDHHFGHANIIRHCERPFASAAGMDAALVANWNACVGPKDEVWVLGDFCYKSNEGPGHILGRLRGRKHLIAGNHDGAETRSADGWASVRDYAEIKVDGRRIVLFHYGLRTWRGISRGALHLYGHSHGRLPGNAQSLDVGVDCWDYRPASLPEIEARLATLPPCGDFGEEDDAEFRRT